jgi:hypothetical protein
MPTLELIYDAVAFYTIPGTPLVLLGYVDVYDEATGLSIYESMRRRWPGAIVIPITVSGTHELTYDGKRVRMCDMETGDLTPAGAAQWCYDELNLGAPEWNPPTPYCQAANGLAMMQALSNVGLKMGSQVPWAMAWWNGREDLLIPPKPWPVLPMPVYHQFRSLYDEFDIGCGLDTWITPSPPPPPKPRARGGHMGLIFETNGTIYDGYAVLNPATGKAKGIALVLDKSAATAYQAEVEAGNQPRPIPDVLNGLYNVYVVGNDAVVAEPQVSDLPGEDASGMVGHPAGTVPGGAHIPAGFTTTKPADPPAREGNLS